MKLLKLLALITVSLIVGILGGCKDGSSGAGPSASCTMNNPIYYNCYTYTGADQASLDSYNSSCGIIGTPGSTCSSGDLGTCTTNIYAELNRTYYFSSSDTSSLIAQSFCASIGGTWN